MPSNKIGLVFSEDYQKYNFGPSHPLRPLRLQLTYSLMEKLGLLNHERLEILIETHNLSEEESIVRDREQELLDKCEKSLNATIKLKEEIEYAIDQLEEKGINRFDLSKISDLAQEYKVDLSDVIVDTFKQDDSTKNALIETLEKIDEIFNLYEQWKEVDLKVF